MTSYDSLNFAHDEHLLERLGSETEDLRADYDTTDIGNAQRFAAENAGKVRFCKSLGGYMVYDGRRYERDELGEVQELAKRTAQTILSHAFAKHGQDRSQREIKAAYEMQSRARVSNMIDLASSIPKIAARASDFDAGQMVINCANGTLDLQTGKLRPHSHDDLLTKLTPIRYRPGVKHERFEQFIYEIMCGDEELIGYLQRLFGYCLTGAVSEHMFAIWIGQGANGKSTLAEMARHWLGDYACTAPRTVITGHQSEGASPEVARLKGVRAAFLSELPRNQKLDEARVKALTGGDTVVARGLFKEFIEFEPTHKLVVETNHLPNIEGTDEGMWRRVHIIPFDASFSGDERDPELLNKLKEPECGTAFLNWALEGLRNWDEGGLAPPSRVLRLVTKYRREMDVLEGFLSGCTVEEKGVSEKASELYAAYKRFCAAEDTEPETQRKFGERLTEKGYGKKKSGTIHYDGLRLVE